MTLRDLAAQRGIRVGTAVADDALGSDPGYRGILTEQLSCVTPENVMKWGLINPQPGVYDFAAGDRLVEFAEQHQQRVRGHTLVWHNQLPAWLTQGSFSSARLASILHEHIETEMGHWRGRIWQWDVVNEAIAEDGTLRSDRWFQNLGQDYVADAFRWARAADPDARLFINDYNVESVNPKSDGLYELVRTLRAEDVPIDGVGFQNHATISGPPSTFRANLERFAALGVDVAITEMDVRMPLPATSEKLAAQAAIYHEAMDLCLAVRRCTGFTVWGFTDRDSWVPGFFEGQGAATLYDEKLQPKPAYRAVVDALEHPVNRTPRDRR